jgi:HSP20 family protein
MLTRFNLSNGAVAMGLREFDQLFREMAACAPRPEGPRELLPPADIYETAEGITVKVDLPGHDPKAIEVKVEGDTLTVRSERKAERSDKEGALRLERSFGVYARSFGLPRTVDGSRVEARYEGGVLTLVLPRREEARARVVEVKHG